MNDQPYQLLVSQGPEPGKVFELTSVSITIGRDPMAEITINDLEVSRSHARLIATLSGYRIQDLGSTNGTYIDGVRLGGEPLELKIGQTITIGSNVDLIFQAVTADVSPSVTMFNEGLGASMLPEREGQLDSVAADPIFNELAESPINEGINGELVNSEIDSIVEEDLDQSSAVEPLAQESFWDSAPQEAAATPFQERSDSYESKDFPEPVIVPHQGEPDIPFSAGESSGNRRLITIIAAISLLVICCCSSLMLFMYYYGGDWLLRQLGLIS